uniref:Uncharacterized protein n=1 Tax=Avena sativa TaxID=4498 RepID=A0ACD5VM58_AVESA
MSPGWWFSAALVVWLAPMLAAVAAAAEEQGDAGCSATRRCGNITISPPFWLRDRTTSSCGLLDLEVSCSNSTPVLRTSTPSGFAILDIRYEERVLHVVDVYDSNSTSEKTCHVPGWNTSDKLGVPFSIGTGNLGLILYNCTAAGAAAASRDGELVRMRCGDGSDDDDHAFVRRGCCGGLQGYRRAGARLVVDGRGERERVRAAHPWRLPPDVGSLCGR